MKSTENLTKPPQRAHAIADVKYAAGWLRCGCGALVMGRTPEDIADAYQAHRKAVAA
jgi:hypothetical protein